MPTARNLEREIRKLRRQGPGGRDLPFLSLCQGMSYEWVNSEDELTNGGDGQITPVEGHDGLPWVDGELSRGFPPIDKHGNLVNESDRR